MKAKSLSTFDTSKSHASPIHEHLVVTGSAVHHLVPFFEVAIAGDWERARELNGEVKELENESQKLKKRLRLSIPRHMLLSELCRDLIDLLSLQNDVAVRTRDIVVLVFARRMQFPTPIQDTLVTLVQTTVMVTECNLCVIDEFDQCLLNGIESRKTAVMEKLIHGLDRLERSTDTLSTSIRGKLFRLENTLETNELVLLHRVIDLISGLAERSQTIGVRLQVLLTS